ncbi:hypothetical protein [Leptothermofonsia sp. ETS-13]|uniref:hypothetical protein n=1 Tax=Leptothermofonsia sp. ETS-13 TaxID=3035696 RepID=UPI003BA10860
MNRQTRPELVAPRRKSSGRSIQRMHAFSSFDELGRRDFLTGLILWVVLMLVSFVLLPGIGAIQPGDRMGTWFSLSLLFGIGGSFLLGASSRFMAITNERASSGSKSLLSIFGQFAGWIGLAGVLFPFIMATGEFFAKLSTN